MVEGLYLTLHHLTKDGIKSMKGISLAEIIDKNVYKHIIAREPERQKKKKDNGSFGEIVWNDRPAHHSHNIKLGHVTEGMFNDYVRYGDNCFQLVEEDKIDIDGASTQMDVLFINKDKKIVYYFESKNNINLDTEKGPATVEKIIKVESALKKMYPSHQVVVRVLTARYPTVDDIPIKLFKNSLTRDNIIGYNEFFKLVGVDRVSFNEWERLWYKQGTYILNETEKISKVAA